LIRGDEIVDTLTKTTSNTAFVSDDATATRAEVTIRRDMTCTQNCSIRILRQALEWPVSDVDLSVTAGAGFLFWSCGDVTVDAGRIIN
jgi:hypothetical protein